MGQLRETAEVLRALGVLTPERVERIKAKAAATGAARVVRAATAYQQTVSDYKEGRAKPLELASVHAELLAALEQNGTEFQAAISQLAALFRSSRGSKR